MWSANFSPDETKIVSASQDGTVKIWNVNSGACIKTLTGHTTVVKYATFTPDGSKIVSASKDNKIKIWNVNTGECLKTLIGHNDYVNHISFSPDGGKIISSSSDGSIKVWNMSSGTCLQSIDAHSWGVNAAFYNSDGSKIVSVGGDGHVKIWDAERGMCLKTFTGEKDACFSLNEDLLAVILDTDILIYDVESQEIIQRLSGHRNFVNTVKYSSDGKKIISASDDYTIKIWGILNADDIL